MSRDEFVGWYHERHQVSTYPEGLQVRKPAAIGKIAINHCVYVINMRVGEG